ncbi:MAG TPA: hypothetical protein VG755_34830 [Nannocystaceae bacterium]|nr:hypothetical protein [Nannocystaceae bacterium]
MANGPLRLGVVAMLGAIACRPPGPPPEPEPPGPICTRDAKLCPDGSAVGRTGPDCTFPPCPGDQTMPPPPNGVSPDPAPPIGPDPDPEPVPM